MVFHFSDDKPRYVPNNIILSSAELVAMWMMMDSYIPEKYKILKGDLIAIDIQLQQEGKVVLEWMPVNSSLIGRFHH